MTFSSDTPVVFFGYNRPHHSAQTFARIKQFKPKHLFVILDGPKAHVPDDAENCAAVRALFCDIDWKCEFRLDAAPVNMGLRKRIPTGLDRVFEEVDRAIIVEDDCLLDPTFFRFAGELLEHYLHDERVGLICAQGDELPGDEASYHASHYPLIWGWATWRRTWRLYDADMKGWPETRDSDMLLRVLSDPLAAAYWRGQMERAFAGFDTWDYSLNYCLWQHDLLSIHPSVNMLNNIGFDATATNTQRRHTPFGERSYPMPFPIVHPDSLDVSLEREARLLAINFGIEPFEVLRRVRDRVSAGPPNAG